MKKKTWIIAGMSLLAAGLMAAALAGCTTADYRFETYSYNYGGVEEKDWRALEYPDEEITMDGLVGAEEYGAGHLSFSDVNDVNMQVYAHMGEEGVFFGFVSDDKYVNYNPMNKDVFNNTSVEIQVAASGTDKLNCDVIQLRLAANGTPDQWIGFRSDNKEYDYTKKYIPSMGVVHIDGKLNESAEGYSVELYLPYTSIGLKEKPDSIVCAPSFNTLPNPTNPSRATWTMMLGCNLSEPATWYVVDETGMTSHTAGFEKTGEEVKQTGVGNEFYYVDSAAKEAYYLKANVTMNSFLNGDNYPKFGLVNKSEEGLQSFHIDAATRTATNFGTVHASQTTAGGTSWEWDTNASTSLDGHWGNTVIGGYANIPLETIYYKGDLYFVLDGVLVKTVHGYTPSSEGAVPGFMCFNTAATFTDIEYETDPAKVQTEAEKFIAKEVKIDGDLTDWTKADVNSHFKQAADPNGNSLKVRAFRGEDGLYLAYEVHHLVKQPDKKWDNGWWLNTNIEFHVNVGKDVQFALSNLGTGGYLDGVMISERDEEGEYDTVAEIFVPFEYLKKEGYDGTSTLRVGFAFKSTHENPTDADKLNGDNWWFFGGAPDNAAYQYNVVEKGIGAEYALTYNAGEGGTGADITEQVFEGDTVTVKSCTFTRSGYTFLHWSDGEHTYAAGDTFKMPAQAVTLTAQWVSDSAADKTYHVTYQKGEGTVTGDLPTDGQDYKAGASFTVADKGTLTRTGYRFMGWQDQDGEKYTGGGTGHIVDKDLVLTAVWAQEFTLTYSAAGAGAGVPEAEKRIAEEKFSLNGSIPTKSGSTFAGWKYAKEGDRIYAAGDDFTMPAEDVTLEAQWTSAITVDGNLADWTALNAKTLSAHSLTDNRGAIWYGVLRSDGLYLAAEFFHDQEPFTGANEWFNNLNFELRIKDTEGTHHWYISVKGSSSDGYTIELGCDADGTSGASANYKHESLTGGRAAHRSVFELFIPAARFEGIKETDGSLRVALAVKTGDNNIQEREHLTGGNFNYEGGDTWYASLGVDPNVPEKFAYVTSDGLYLRDEHDSPDVKFGIANAADDDSSITVDGVLTDWEGVQSIKVEGSDTYLGKSATFYGKLTKKGLYVAVEAYHGTFTTNGDAWHTHTNFELQIGSMFNGGRISAQHWVSATGNTTFNKSHAYMQVAFKHEKATEHNNATEHTIVEFFIPAANLPDAMIRDGSIRVGVAWKTPGDKINNNGVSASGDGVDEWWNPQGEHVNDNLTYVDGDGMYLSSEYANKKQ